MSRSLEIEPFLKPLKAIQRLLEKLDNQGVIIGGIAVSVLVRPRMTADLDAMVLASIDQVPTILALANEEGLLPRIPNAVEFATRNRILLLRHMDTQVDIDLALGLLPFEKEMVQRSQTIELGTLTLRLPTIEDLVILKAVAHRARDMEDIRVVLENQPPLDISRLEFWLKHFAEVLENPAIWDDIKNILQNKER